MIAEFAAALLTASATPGAIEVAHVRTALGSPASCLSDRFLTTLADQTGWVIDPVLHAVAVDAPALDRYALAVLSQSGPYELADAEVERLSDWLRTGGSLLITGPCGPGDWSVGAERAARRLAGEAALQPVPREHPLFHALFDLGPLVRTDGAPGELFAVEIDGRLAILYAPDGLNDTDRAGGGCCCCGGHELRDAPFVLANWVTLALTP